MMKTIIFLSFFLIHGTAVFASSTDELHVEGISYEPQNEAASIAIINGEFLNEGGSVGHYKVVKIGGNFVRVRDEQTGFESELGVTGSAPKTEAPLETPAEEAPLAAAAPAQTPQPVPKPAASNPLALLNPMGMIDLANEVAILAALKQISMAAQAYFSMNEGQQSITLEELIKMDMISNIYANEYKGYRFSVKSTYDNIQVFADPATDDPNREHYLVDRHGVVRVEKGKQATDQSPPQNA